jgi:aryl-alcohol dehydrogenase-like predicted oxidoreductase
MSKLGFGTYRMSVRSKEHRESLELALQNGLSLIDTSSNYTNGDSELLIGEILSQLERKKHPIIVTKAGYIQGKILESVLKQDSYQEIIDVADNLKHCIHPSFLDAQINQSLERLKVPFIDYFLLHNPEYYFKLEGANQTEYYRRIKEAFLFLEKKVSEGLIKNYGISSNHFTLPLNHPEVTNLSKILELTKEIDAKHFQMIQFPFNLIEIGALEKFGEYGDLSLLELAQLNQLKTVINRPLNAFIQNKLVRLATYDDQINKLDKEKALEQFDLCLSLLHEKWNEAVDDNVTTDDFKSMDLVVQLKDIWNQLPTPDAVDQVYHAHFFPFIAKVWGRDLSPEEAAPFFKLFEYSHLFSRLHMTNKANDFRNQAEQVGLMEIEKEKSFSIKTIETYLDYGFDYVLVGMKKPEYVNQLKHLL